MATETNDPAEQAERDTALAAERAAGDAERKRIKSYGTWYLQDLRNAEPVAEPAYFPRSDGRRLVYPGRAHAFVGESETYKSFAAMLACKSVVDEGGSALYIDFENNAADTRDRALAVGIPADAFGRSFGYVRPDEPLRDVFKVGPETALERGLIAAYRELRKPQLVVIDGVTEVLALHGLNENRATEVVKYQQLLGRKFVRSGSAVIEVDHAGHEAERALGSQHKRAGLDGAVYFFKRAGKLGGRDGRTKINVTVLKDRPGFVRSFAAGKDVATFEIGGGSFRLVAPSEKMADLAAPPEELRAVARVLEAAGDEWVSEKSVCAAEDVKGRREVVAQRLEYLRAQGFVESRSEDHGTQTWAFWRSVKPYP